MKEIFTHPFLVFLIGNIGTGKTTISKIIQTEYGGKIISLDEFKMENLEIEEPELTIKFRLLVEHELKHKNSLILDGKHLIRNHRTRLITYGKRYDIKVIAIDCGKGDEKSLQNRLNENRGLQVKEWEEEHFKSFWEYEEPTVEEGFNLILKKEIFIF